MTDRLINAFKSYSTGLDMAAGQPKFGVVTSMDYNTNTARVMTQPEGVLSGWLPVLSPWIGNGWGLICPLSPGDQVFILPQEGDVEQGVIVGRAYSKAQRPPVAPVGEFWLIHKSGSFIKLCNDGTIHMAGDLHVDGDVYDRSGSLAQLRQVYDQHTHKLPNNGVTSVPMQQD